MAFNIQVIKKVSREFTMWLITENFHQCLEKSTTGLFRQLEFCTLACFQYILKVN